MSAPIGKTASGSFCSHQQESEMLKIENSELKSKIASLESEKEKVQEESNNKTINQISKERDLIASIIPRNLPQYRTDEDFQRELEHRVNQLNEFTTIEDLKGLYDAKIWKHAKKLAAKTASWEASDRFSSIYNPLSNIGHNGIKQSRAWTLKIIETKRRNGTEII